MLDKVFQQGPRPSAAAPSSLLISRHLEPGDRDIWEAALGHYERRYRKCEEFALEGDVPRALFVVLEGWAQSYRQLSDGRRQITAFRLPGQVFDIDILTRSRHGHTLAAIDALRVAEIPGPDLEALFQQCPGLLAAILRSATVASAVQREWLISVGTKSAHERIAHLLCELYILQGGGSRTEEVDLPITQAQMAEALGLTPVHVNRTMRDLSAAFGVEVQQRRLRIADFAGLSAAGTFKSSYLGSP